MARSLAGAGLKRLVRRSEVDDLALGEVLLSELDQMKGMAMKVGQILSYMDVPLPDATRDALARLQSGVEPLAFDVIAATVEAELGAPIPELFERFDAVPIAAASIGQVHRASVGGQEVAVKVRYPGVSDSFDADMAVMHRFAGLAGLATMVDGHAIVEELHARLHEECDYRREAHWQRVFGEAFAHDPVLRVPRVVPSHSSAGVLTTHWHDGRALLDAPLEPEVMMALVRSTWHSAFVLQTVQADPHPGNFVVGEGTLTCLDYGCVRAFDPDFIEPWRDVFLAVLHRDRATFDAATHATGLVGSERFDLDAHHAMMAYALEPYCTPHFRFDEAWLARGRSFSGPKQPNGRRMRIQPQWIWFLRLWFGLHAVLTRVRAEGDFRSALTDALQAEPRRLVAP